jgi:hypothetical protein
LLAVLTDQIRPPIKSQKEEKFANLIIYACTINQIPLVFGEYHFAGHKHKYMEKFTKRRFQTLICAKEQGRHLLNQLKKGKAPWGTDPCPTQGLPRKGGGEAA